MDRTRYRAGRNLLARIDDGRVTGPGNGDPPASSTPGDLSRRDGPDDVVVRVPRPDLGTERNGGLPLFFRAELQPDGNYAVVLTEPGVRTFESSLALAWDFGGESRLSPHSTIADLMERTAVREELSRLMREERPERVRRLQGAVLRRRLRGSERPAMYERVAGHVGKAIIVGLVLLWTVTQFAVAVGDIGAIPGILAQIPSDILHLNPTAPINEVGQEISDAGLHAVYGVLGVCLTYVAAKLVRPLARIYRRDGVIPGERSVLRALSYWLRRTGGT